MFFVALATDYDGTLARNGHVDAPTRRALAELRSSGRKLILVTGRELPDLRRVFDDLALFDLIVAENGAVLLVPATQEEIPLSGPPPAALVERLRAQGVHPLSVGHTIIATWEPHEKIVLEAIRDLGLEQHIIFNKGAVMVLPSDVNKATGLMSALERLELSPHNVVGIGDAENDQSFMNLCGCAVAVDNALPAVKEKADFAVADHGAGVIELASKLIENDLSDFRAAILRQQPVVGVTRPGWDVALAPFDTVLVTGHSGGGKSTIVIALLEQLHEMGYQFCIIDPEGDYSEMKDATVVGDAKQEPRLKEIETLLANPVMNVVINLLAIEPADRPPFLAKLLPDLATLRAKAGRPHWIVLDEAHHCLPANWSPAPVTLPQELPAVIAVTVHPSSLAKSFLAMVSTVIGVGDEAAGAIDEFCKAAGRKITRPQSATPQDGILVLRAGDQEPIVATARRPKDKQQRHARKYSEGELEEDRSFYFRGPQGALKLRAQNLQTFLQLADGVDDKTWLHHLRQGEYSRWFLESIKDEGLAATAASIEKDHSISADQSKNLIRKLVERLYTAPAKGN
jgi:hydroxymethylpyrimidine pyrophosphatase-like HAD family hydrolase